MESKIEKLIEKYENENRNINNSYSLIHYKRDKKFSYKSLMLALFIISLNFSFLQFSSGVEPTGILMLLIIMNLATLLILQILYISNMINFFKLKNDNKSHVGISFLLLLPFFGIVVILKEYFLNTGMSNFDSGFLSLNIMHFTFFVLFSLAYFKNVEKSKLFKSEKEMNNIRNKKNDLEKEITGHSFSVESLDYLLTYCNEKGFINSAGLFTILLDKKLKPMGYKTLTELKRDKYLKNRKNKIINS